MPRPSSAQLNALGNSSPASLAFQKPAPVGHYLHYLHYFRNLSHSHFTATLQINNCVVSLHLAPSPSGEAHWEHMQTGP